MDVSLERASDRDSVAAGEVVTLAQLRSIIKNNGFTAKEATVTVVGKLIERGGQLALEVTGTNTVMLIVADPKQPAIFKQAQERLLAKASDVIRITGMVETNANLPDRITVRVLADEKP